MAKHTRVRNLTTGIYLKRNRALGLIEQGAAVWVEENSTMRNLSLSETITAGSEKANAILRDMSIAKVMKMSITKEHGVYQGGLCSPR